MSWLRPANSSASDSLPSGPSKRYSALTSSQGRSRRAWLSASRSRVNAFSRTRSARRAFSHCSCETTLCLPLMPLDSCGAVNGGCSGADPGIQCPASYARVWLWVKRGAGAIPSHGGPGGAPLTVLRTSTGAAQSVAVALDKAEWPEVVGTISGDDTIFIAPADPRAQQRLLARLREHFGA